MVATLSFSVEDLRPLIGSSIEASAQDLLDGRYAREIRQLLEQRGVLIFPGAALDDEQQLSFARTLGDVIPQGDEGIFKITLDQTVSASADYLRSTIYWHFDGFSDDVPSLASILTSKSLPATGGGQTEFANTYAAFDALPASRQKELEALRVGHSVENILRLTTPNPTAAETARWALSPTKVHPLVWTHQYGRKSLLLGSSALYVEGMDPEEGRALLNELLEWATRPEFVYRHEWTVGDVLIWDNTGTLHRVLPYAPDSGRLLHRTTLVGEEAIA
jgi:alpha-ketoglutarate-dependent taurine dioxygenase